MHLVNKFEFLRVSLLMWTIIWTLDNIRMFNNSNKLSIFSIISTKIKGLKDRKWHLIIVFNINLFQLHWQGPPRYINFKFQLYKIPRIASAKNTKRRYWNCLFVLVNCKKNSKYSRRFYGDRNKNCCNKSHKTRIWYWLMKLNRLGFGLQPKGFPVAFFSCPRYLTWLPCPLIGPYLLPVEGKKICGENPWLVGLSLAKGQAELQPQVFSLKRQCQS